MISKDRRYAFQRYRDFVESGIDESLEDPLKKIYGGAILGGKTFFLSLLWQGSILVFLHLRKQVRQDRFLRF
jgi:hypothetical protein